MNRELALYFGHDFLIAGIQPYEDNFKVIQKRGIRKFPLYFYIDPTSNTWDYGDRYRVNFQKGDQNAVGNFYQLIQENRSTFTVRGYEKDFIDLLDKILDDLKDRYVDLFSDLASSDIDLKSLSPIPVRVAYSDNVPEPAQPILEDYLANRGFKISPPAPHFGELLTRRLILERGLSEDARKTLVLDAFSNDLNVSLIKINGPEKIHRESLGIYRGYGADPRVSVIAKYVVDEVNANLHILNSDEAKADEYARHIEAAREWRDQLDTTRKPFLQVKTGISAAPNSSWKVNIPKQSVKDLSLLHIRQITRYIDGQVKDAGLEAADLDAIVVIGDMLNHATVQLELQQAFGADKIIRKSEQQLSEILKTMLSDAPVITPTEAAPAVAPAPVSPTENMHVLLSSQLSRGDKVEFGWSPPGKPVRKVQAMYNGNLSYTIVLAENSSIIEGDTFKCEGFFLGRPVLLKQVFRTLNDQAKGDYSTNSPLMVLRKV